MLSKKDRMHIVSRNYRHKIEIWDLLSTEENELGEEVQVPKKVYDLWAEVTPARGKEYLSVDKLAAEMQYKIVTRYRPDINQAMLIKWQGRELNIKAIIDISGKEEHMEIMCVEKVNIKFVEKVDTNV